MNNSQSQYLEREVLPLDYGIPGGTNNTLNIFICAGETSGDLHAAEVLEQLQNLAVQKKTNLKAWGMGGKCLQKAGLDIVQDSTNLGVIGIADVLKKLAFFWKLQNTLVSEIKKRKPEIALLIDYPGLNLRLAAEIKKHLPSCKIVYYVAPQVWAWNKSRINKIPNLVDRLFPVLPFEEELHQEAGTSTKYVGNPTAYSLGQFKKPDKKEFLSSIHLSKTKKTIGIFPGSRKREIQFMLPTFLESAKKLFKRNNNVQFALVRANSIPKELIRKEITKSGISENLIRIIDFDKRHEVLSSVDIAWLKSGTVTLEAACHKTPLILGYKENPLFWKVYLWIRKINWIGLPNIIANENVCPELLQEACIAANWVELTERIINSDETRQTFIKILEEKVVNKLDLKQNPALAIAKEIIMMNEIANTEAENRLYMREVAFKNSQETQRNLSNK